MNNKEVIKTLVKIRAQSQDQTERESLDRAIAAVGCYRNCKNCVHRVVKSKYAFCEIWDCDYEPKPAPELAEVGT